MSTFGKALNYPHYEIFVVGFGKTNYKIHKNVDPYSVGNKMEHNMKQITQYCG
jgi:hypothetical protein